MKEKDIKKLIEKYFDGDTTCAEERILRHLFTTNKVPPSLEIYRPLFAYLDKEATNCRQTEDVAHTRRKMGRSLILRVASGIAASILLCLGITRFLPTLQSTDCFVIIDGKRYTDLSLVQSKAQEALLNVSFTNEELNQLLCPIEP